MRIDTIRLLNILLRVTTLGARFVFVIVLAKFLDPAMVGYYGLFTATIGYVLYIVGLDFYTYVTREILRARPHQRGSFIKGQAVLSCGLYLIVLPASLALLSRADWPNFLLWWFVPILVLEHFNQEVSRLLIAMSQQIFASIVLFLRQGSWAIATLLLMTSTPDSRNLKVVFALWAAGGLAAALLGGWKLSRLEIGGWLKPVDWRWLRRGVVVSGGFLIATLALRAVQTIDRYWLEALGGIDMVAAYVLFMGVAGSLMVFLDAGVFAFAYPKLIELSHNHEYSQVRALVRRSLLQTILVCGAFAIASWVLLPYLLRWIGNPVYLANQDLFPFILLAMILSAIGMIPHYALYASALDKPIITSHVVGLGSFLLATWWIGKAGDALAIPIGLTISFLMILILKSGAYFLLMPHSKRELATKAS